MAGAQWDGVTQRSTYSENYLARRDELADAARDADWDEVFPIVGEWGMSVNNWRVGGASWYSVLHQAAWHGADAAVVTRLVEAGGWRTLRTRGGLRAVDIAAERGHGHLADLLAPLVRHPVAGELLDALESGLHSVVMSRSGTLVEQEQLRLPDVAPLTELADPSCQFQVPGMYGGFIYRLEGEELEIKSYSRVIGGSGQTHRVSGSAVELVESGWG